MNDSSQHTSSTRSMTEPWSLLGIGLLFGFFITLVCVTTVFKIAPDRLRTNIDSLGPGWPGIASIILLPLLTSIYLYAYSFYKDKFFFFVAISWVHNLFYMVFIEGWRQKSDPQFLLLQVLLSFSSDFYLYLAATSKKGEKLELLHVIVPIIPFLLWFFVQFGPDLGIDKVKLLFFVGPLYAFYVLFITARAISRRFKKTFFSRTLSYTFLVYAIFQFSFLLKSFLPETLGFSPDPEFVAKLLFSIMMASVILKLFNGLALGVLLSRDFADGRFKLEKELMDAEKQVELLEKDKKLLAASKELLKAEKELDDERLLVKSEFEDIGILTASIEHELRNPLSTIYNIITLLKAQYQADNHLQKYLDNLDKERRSMLAATEIVNTLRSSREDVIDKLKEIDLDVFLKGVIRNVKTEQAEKAEHIYFRLNKEPIDSRDKQLIDMFIKGFSFLLEKVFINITKNSVESILSANKKSVINFDVGLQGKDKIIISICDTGLGFIDQKGEKIPDDKIYDTVTKASYTTKTPGESKANRGIGLFVCDRVIRMHRGKMQFSNLKEGGACVSIIMDRYFSHRMRKKDATETS